MPDSISPKRSRGQHFLVDRDILLFEVQRARVTRHDTVLEVGAGFGNLTRLLSEKAERVIAIEVDDQFRESLEALAADRGLAPETVAAGTR